MADGGKLTPAEAEETAAWLKTLGAQLQGPSFQDWSRGFIAAHCGAFDLAEENKLEYTRVHEAYQAGAEERLEVAGREAGVPVEALLARLPAFVASAREQAVDEAAAECLDTLTSLTDFEAFKATMLVAKRDREGGAGQEEGMAYAELAQGVQDLEGLMRMASHADDHGEAWTVLTDKDWIRISRKPAQDPARPNEQLLRVTLRMDLPLADMRRMLLEYGPDRRHWDDTFRGAEVLETFPGRPGVALDQALHIRFAMPFLLRAAGLPNELTARLVWVEDAPRKGEHTFGMLPWGDQGAQKNMVSSAMGVVKADPQSPEDRSIYTGIEQFAASGMPDWLLGWMARTFSPRYMMGMADRYKKFKAGTSAKK